MLSVRLKMAGDTIEYIDCVSDEGMKEGVNMVGHWIVLRRKSSEP